MRKSAFSLLALSFLCVLSLSMVSCTKINDAVNNASGNNQDTTTICGKIRNVKIKPVASVTEGGTISLNADDAQDAMYFWSGPDNFQSYDQNNTISDIDYTQMGWYYLNVTAQECSSTAFDSVYVNVAFPQGTPSCSLTNNVVTFDGLPDQDFTSGVSLDLPAGDYTLEGSSDAGDITIILNPYWLNSQPADGVYQTTSIQSFDYTNIGQIFISDVNSDIYFVAAPNKPVYVSHVNGKLQISFCDINFSGDNGQQSFTVSTSGRVTVR
jgi:hypothetical protein